MKTKISKAVYLLLLVMLCLIYKESKAQTPCGSRNVYTNIIDYCNSGLNVYIYANSVDTSSISIDTIILNIGGTSIVRTGVPYIYEFIPIPSPAPSVMHYTYWVSYSDGCIQTESDSVILYSRYTTCLPRFTFSQVYNTATFSNTTICSDPDVSYTWSFGDGYTDTGTTTTHTYRGPGTYYVELRANSPSGYCPAITRDTIVIDSVVPIPCAERTISYSAFDYCESGVYFWGNPDHDTVYSNVDSMQLLIGGTVVYSHPIYIVATLPIITPSTPSPLVYCFRVFYNDGCIRDTCDSLVLYPRYSLCSPSYTYTQTLSSVTFTNTTSCSDPYVNYYWDFGDGYSSSTFSPSHIYTYPGTYYVKLYANRDSDSSFVTDTCPVVFLDTIFITSITPFIDNSIGYTSTILRAGFNAQVYLYTSNQGTLTNTSSTYYQYDAHLTFSSSAPTPSYHDAANRILRWDVASFIPGDWDYYTLNFLVDSFVTDSTLLCDSVWITPISGDINPANNIVENCGFPIRSYDPNEKTVVPKGVGVDGNVDYLSTTKLTYQLKFQNTGSGPAGHVALVDILDSDLDPTSIKFIGSSHTYNYSIEGNKLVIRFQEIELPASSVNEPGSHGYVTFTIDIKPASRVIGTRIENNVDIYFDWNAPIRTNTTVTTLNRLNSIQEVQVNAAQVFPNPVQNELHIVKGEESIKQIVVTNLISSTIIKVPYTENANEFIINMSSVPAGTYVIQLIKQSGIEYKKVIKK